MATGTVKWFNDTKGFGFITPGGGGDDLFAHVSEIKVQGVKSLAENQKVSFDITTRPKGQQDTIIQIIGSSSTPKRYTRPRPGFSVSGPLYCPAGKNHSPVPARSRTLCGNDTRATDSRHSVAASLQTS